MNCGHAKPERVTTTQPGEECRGRDLVTWD